MQEKKKDSQRESKEFIYNEIIAKEFETDKRFVYHNENKEPVDSKGYLISLIPKNFLDFKKALIGFKNSPKIVGIGIVLGNICEKNLCGIDIDNCIDENGKIHPRVKEIIDLFDTYTEISPSGKGIHILFFAKKKGSRCKVFFSWCKCMEIYDKDRYFTLTGNVINSKGIEDRQSQCDIFYQKYFKQDSENHKPFKPNETSKNTDKNGYKSFFENYALEKDPVLKKYWEGYRSHKSESENDFALMGKLLHWLKKPHLAIEFFLDSPFAKTKDQYHFEKMNRKNYLWNTAMNVIRRNGGRII